MKSRLSRPSLSSLIQQVYQATQTNAFNHSRRNPGKDDDRSDASHHVCKKNQLQHAPQMPRLTSARNAACILGCPPQGRQCKGKRALPTHVKSTGRTLPDMIRSLGPLVLYLLPCLAKGYRTSRAAVCSSHTFDRRASSSVKGKILRSSGRLTR